MAHFYIIQKMPPHKRQFKLGAPSLQESYYFLSAVVGADDAVKRTIFAR